MNIAAGVISGEVGLYFDHRISDRLGLELSYGHRFYSFNFVQGGGDQAYKYVPQTADVIRVGLKTYIGSNSNTIGKPNKYIVYRLGAWNLHTPKYINREGPNGLNTTERSIVSVDKNVLNFAVGLGKEITRKNLFMDLFASFGFSAGTKSTHYYQSANIGGGALPVHYYNNYYDKKIAFFPFLEFGWKVGF